MNTKALSLYPSSSISVSKFRSDSQKILWNATVEFESFFIKQMLDSMKRTIGKDKLLDGKLREEVFDDMLCQQRAFSIAKSGSFGLAKLLYHQLSQIQSLQSLSRK